MTRDYENGNERIRRSRSNWISDDRVIVIIIVVLVLGGILFGGAGAAILQTLKSVFASFDGTWLYFAAVGFFIGFLLGKKSR